MSEDRRSTRRVVVTGMGAVTPLGLSVEAFWQAMLRGESGARTIQGFDASDLPTRFACELHGFDPLAYFDRKKARHLDPFCHYAVAAADEAAATPASVSRSCRRSADRIGIVSARGSAASARCTTRSGRGGTKGVRRLSPFFIP